MQLEGKIVIVTGGAAGIGGAISRVLTARGAKVVAVDIDAAAGTALEADRGTDVAFIQADVGLPETAERAVRTAVERFGGLTGV